MQNILSSNKVENKEQFSLELIKTNLYNFILETEIFIQNNMKELNKPLVEINFLKLKILYQVIYLVLIDKFENYSNINFHKNEIYKDLESLKIKEYFLNENTKCSESFFRNTVFIIPNIWKISDFLITLFNEFEMDDNIINDLKSKCISNTIKFKDEDSMNISYSTCFLKKKRHSSLNTPEKNNNLKVEKIYNYFKKLNKSNDGTTIITSQLNEKKYNSILTKNSISEDNCNSFEILGTSNLSNFNTPVDFFNHKIPFTSIKKRKCNEDYYFSEVLENSNFSFSDRNIVLFGNYFNNFSSSSKKSTNYSMISYPTLKEISVMEPGGLKHDQILFDKNNNMKSNQHNLHRGINRRLPELQFLPRTKKKQLSSKKKKSKVKTSILYKYFDDLNKSKSGKSDSEDENYKFDNKREINTSIYRLKQIFEMDDNKGEDNLSSRKSNISIKNFNNKEINSSLREEVMKNMKNADHSNQSKSLFKTSIYNKINFSPHPAEKSEDEIIAFSTPDKVDLKIYNTKPKICVNLFNNQSHH